MNKKKAPVPPNPTELPDRSWVFALRKKGDYPKPAGRNGKWLIFVPVSKIDEVWKKIRQATEDGLLGDHSRASTGRGKTHFAEEPDSRVIEVYTYDFQDKKDVMRIRAKLKTLGFKDELHYKTEGDTVSGNYSGNVGHRVDKFTA
jgi:hypothetical protein